MDSWVIQLLGRWGSATVLQYIRDAPLKSSAEWARLASERSLSRLFASCVHSGHAGSPPSGLSIAGDDATSPPPPKLRREVCTSTSELNHEVVSLTERVARLELRGPLPVDKAELADLLRLELLVWVESSGATTPTNTPAHAEPSPAAGEQLATPAAPTVRLWRNLSSGLVHRECDKPGLVGRAHCSWKFHEGFNAEVVSACNSYKYVCERCFPACREQRKRRLAAAVGMEAPPAGSGGPFLGPCLRWSRSQPSEFRVKETHKQFDL